MITDAFDAHSPEYILPHMIHPSREKVCDKCVITFSRDVVENIPEVFPCEKIAEINSVNGGFPVYLIEYKGIKAAFYLSMIGASSAASCLEEAHFITGAQQFIMFGSCGSLCRGITAGKIVVPSFAYRDEGCSYHYAPASDTIAIPGSGKVAQFFKQAAIPHTVGGTWTTDGIYRETHDNVKKRKAAGCIVVEMECAALQAVCQYRGMEFYPFLYSGDLLDAQEWDVRILGSDNEYDHQMRNFCFALDLAMTL